MNVFKEQNPIIKKTIKIVSRNPNLRNSSYNLQQRLVYAYIMTLYNLKLFMGHFSLLHVFNSFIELLVKIKK